MESLEQLEEQAINAALKHQWDEAILLNKQIISLDQVNFGTYLRLGFAYMQKHELAKAKTFYRKILKMQPVNRIALENLEKIKILEKRKKTILNTTNSNLNPNVFLEIPGKTKTVKLVKLGQKEELAGLIIGQEVQLKQKKRKIEIRTQQNDYIGSLPDDVSQRLKYFIKEKSTYTCFIKETSLTEVVVFIKEETKGRKVQRYLSFAQNPHTVMSDIKQEETSEHEDEEEWIGVGEEVEVVEKDEDLEHIKQDNYDESEEE
ncbi:hypothetical protein A3F03_04210 [Candidatus Roizmanbacteria bacterium RIFCSPHIGHO2_12_FULL_41_11]|uniref:Uncharacterized protein n=3 Tax=Candidatus Roizmaniibacteriota TaxID=1752723 RepID=A0A1F7JR98_9BACT|nr:MAG: hypothetical protein A3F03_04210 [Candidatus Roizmanbacteria bacterium RIFCSPHIGHO2_12_FULL_41_11]OGK51011.1 MAG: hypothetical protein A2966_02785 [Candidatus Roizmanbacteria bacterium RIFCSPLOWO2_01_FULL_41_22]OGK58144.1 MAG: hypothetical protein A3H86_04110 [Candidatus Roizmanbacteria bacterium RIFCSPLOWO2_02_FULL_41_9]